MKEIVMYARYNQAGNKAVCAILDKMSNDEREKDQGSYFKSLTGLFRHVYGATKGILGMLKEALAGNASASKAIATLETIPAPAEGQFSEAQWKEFAGNLEKVDAAYLDLVNALSDSDLTLPVKCKWFGGNPESVPLSFMLSMILLHNTHHRGQISQIFDSLKIDNDFSGLSPAFLSN